MIARAFFLTLLIACALAGGSLRAQEASDPGATPPNAEDYRAFAEERGISTSFYPQVTETEVAEAPPEETEEAAQEQRESNLPWELGWSQLVTTILVVALVAGFVVLLFQNAGLLGVDLQQQRRQAARKAAQAEPLRAEELQARTRAYAKRADRIEAIEDMLAEAFAKAERDLDTIFGEADTARELERRLAGQWRHHGPLQGLIQASEQSQFAGVPLSADQYQACLRAYGQIMGPAT